jgi:hypothetical protein
MEMIVMLQVTFILWLVSLMPAVDAVAMKGVDVGDVSQAKQSRHTTL